MGIKGLAHVLQPHAMRLEFPELPSIFAATSSLASLSARATTSVARSTCDPLQPHHPIQDAVIDGPSLAYFAYRRALVLRGPGRTPLNAQPEYAEVTWIVQRCLQTMLDHGIHIGAIFFDGVLPPSKLSVRRQRLEASLRQLLDYRSNHSSQPWPNPEDDDDHQVFTEPSSFIPFSHALMPPRLDTLPALPFLVPAVIEALQSSPFKDITTVVPGEADGYCASYAKEHAAIVITSDSDLFVYQLHPESSVVLWKDIEQVTSGPKGSLKLLSYHAPSIAQQLSIKSIQSLAFAIARDPHNAIMISHVEKARVTELNTTRDYETFLDDYKVPAHNESMATQEAFSSLDPRTSEWIHQAMAKAAHDGRKTMYVMSNLKMFLPVLYEDTARTSPWQPAEELRTLAYSIILPSHGYLPECKNVTSETCRKGRRLDSKAIEHFHASEISLMSGSYVRTIDHVNGKVPRILRWQYLGLIQLRDTNRSISQRSLVKAVLRNQRPFQSWEHVHLTAQVQATLYSWRILKQCLHVKQCSSSAFSDNVEGVDALHNRVKDMPSIAKLFDPLDHVEEHVLDNVIDVMYEYMRVQEVIAGPVVSRAEKKREKKKRRKEIGDEKLTSSKAIKTVHASSNMYDLLSNQE